MIFLVGFFFLGAELFGELNCQLQVKLTMLFFKEIDTTNRCDKLVQKLVVYYLIKKIQLGPFFVGVEIFLQRNKMSETLTKCLTPNSEIIIITIIFPIL